MEFQDSCNPTAAPPVHEPVEEGLALHEDDLGRRLAAERPYLLRFLGRLARGARRAPDAEDVAQDVLARALTYRSFDSDRPLRPWLRQAALRTFLDHVARGRAAPDELASEPHAPPGPSCDDREHLEHLLRELAPLERTLLVEFHQRGRSIADLASDHGLPQGTVKSHLHRARRKLARRSNPDGGPR